MAFQRVPNTVEIQVVQTLYSATIVNTYHAFASAGYNQGMLDTLAFQISNTPASGMLADQSLSLEYIRTDVRGLDVINDLMATDNTGTGLGLVGTRACPPQVVFAIQRLSGLSGRSARGRVYISGIPFATGPFDLDTTKTLNATWADAYKGHVEAFRTTIEAIGPWDAVIVSRWLEGVKRIEGVTFKWTVTAYHDRKVDTLRGRLV